MRLGKITLLAALLAGAAAFVIGLSLGKQAADPVAQDEDGSANPKGRKPLTALDASSDRTKTRQEIRKALKTHRGSFFSCMQTLAKTVRETDLADLPTLVRELENELPEMHARLMGGLLKRRLQSEDSAEVLAMFENIPNISRRLAKIIVDLGIENSPDRTFELLESIESDQQRKDLRESALKRLASTDPKAAVGRIAGLPIDQRRAAVLSNLRTLKNGAPDELMALVNQTPSEYHSTGDLAKHLFRELAGIDPKQAIPSLDSLADPRQRQGAAEVLARAWPRDDIDAGLAWAETEASNSRIVRELLGRLAQKDPQAALAKAEQITDLEARSSLISQSGAEWLGSDPLTATAWLDENVSWKPRQDAFSQAILTGSTSADNIEKLVPIFERLESGSDAAKIFAERWVRADREAASTYASQLEAGPKRETFTRLLAELEEGEEEKK